MELGVLSSEEISCRQLPCCQRSPHWALLGFSPLYFRLKASAVMPVTPFLSQPLSVCSCSSQTFPSCLPVPKGESDWLAILTLPRAIRPHLLLVLSPSLCPQPEWPQQCFMLLLLVLTPWLPTLSSHLLAPWSISAPLGTKLRRWCGLHCTCPGGRGAAPACGVDLMGPAEALAAALWGAHNT